MDCHIYENQIDGVREQLTREPHTLPTLVIPNNDNGEKYPFDIFKWEHTQYELLNYKYHPPIKMEITV